MYYVKVKREDGKQFEIELANELDCWVISDNGTRFDEIAYATELKENVEKDKSFIIVEIIEE